MYMSIEWQGIGGLVLVRMVLCVALIMGDIFLVSPWRGVRGGGGAHVFLGGGRGGGGGGAHVLLGEGSGRGFGHVLAEKRVTF